MPWKDVVRSAVELAKNGFAVDDALARSLNQVAGHGKEFPELKRVYGKEDGKWKASDKLIQKDLARTLCAIEEKGADGFYKGEGQRSC